MNGFVLSFRPRQLPKESFAREDIPFSLACKNSLLAIFGQKQADN
jgi:hypothetical protein